MDEKVIKNCKMIQINPISGTDHIIVRSDTESSYQTYYEHETGVQVDLRLDKIPQIWSRL